jgi:hypothetical protein
MKFPDLPNGSRFIWQGEHYCKTGPMTADAADGCKKLIPRSARIAPVDAAETTAAPAGAAAEIAAADVAAALAALTQSLRDFAETLQGPPRSALAQRIDVAEAAFRRALKL